MNNNKLIKILIPIVAIVVVFESIILVNNLEKPVADKVQETKVEDKPQVTEVPAEPVVSFDFKVNSKTIKEMKLGKTYKIDMVLNPMENKAIDGLETYIKYDPEIFKIANLVSSSKIVKPEVSKVDDQIGMLSNILLIEEKEGLALKSAKEITVLSFNLTPMEEGDYSLELSRDSVDKKYDTLLVETGTAKTLGWTGGKLDVKVTK